MKTTQKKTEEKAEKKPAYWQVQLDKSYVRTVSRLELTTTGLVVTFKDANDIPFLGAVNELNIGELKEKRVNCAHAPNPETGKMERVGLVFAFLPTTKDHRVWLATKLQTTGLVGERRPTPQDFEAGTLCYTFATAFAVDSVKEEFEALGISYKDGVNFAPAIRRLILKPNEETSASTATA